MSHRDRELVRSIGLPVAQLAHALEKSRQAVNRGIRSETDYFKPADLIKALGAWRSSDAGFYTVARDSVCALYPEIASSVLEAVRSGSKRAFSRTMPGEYWFICGDFVGFRTNLPNCSKELEAICTLDTAQALLFVNERDHRAAARFAAKFQGQHTDVVPCTTVDLRRMPIMLLRMDDHDNVDLYGVADEGFVALSRLEAARWRMVVQDDLLKPKIAEALQGVEAN